MLSANTVYYSTSYYVQKVGSTVGPNKSCDSPLASYSARTAARSIFLALFQTDEEPLSGVLSATVHRMKLQSRLVTQTSPQYSGPNLTVDCEYCHRTSSIHLQSTVQYRSEHWHSPGAFRNLESEQYSDQSEPGRSSDEHAYRSRENVQLQCPSREL